MIDTIMVEIVDVIHAEGNIKMTNKFEREISRNALNEKIYKAFLSELGLVKIDTPISLRKTSGLQDNLTGSETPLQYVNNDDIIYEIPHSLAKWKRMMLGHMCDTRLCHIYNGIVVDTRALRICEIEDDTHSIEVKQYDWEMVISDDQRNLTFLKEVVKIIYGILRNILKDSMNLPDEIVFINYPDDSTDDAQFEYEHCKKHGACFFIGAGQNRNRSPDYDDWKLNGDLILYDKKYDRAIELSSMGIRVNADSLAEQMKIANKPYLEYHNDINDLPLTIGGGIGQQRLFMLLKGEKSINM
jgi:aspartate--ammonia ligase